MYLEHANITVKSIAESEKFLVSAFPDFVIRGSGRRPSDDRLWVHIGNQQVYLALNEMPQHKPLDLTDYAQDGVNHLGWVVDDLDAIDQRLQSSGYAEIIEFQEENEYRRRHYYRDGNGFEWEFVEYLTERAEQRNQY
ncbi:VOC family protein [Pelagibaculum spongiae]|uniref:Lactoylglutathione lyase n=1 Tax=Pelagibaculum spongiae TaxID=2080658 RepID=A0A2V1GZP7_9GAMM|nr:VOC family protein [Pelagibaculum spongiae]PVZ72206.1 lactoylglutathione lyase [Pelagibaculum spongiae]